MRGERPFSISYQPICDGSSPHARGTHDGGQRPGTGHRFIPACAGNAPTASAATCPWTVHPRMRGERTITQDGAYEDVGSSPHARGTRRHVGGYETVRRFIPACAGNAARSAGGPVPWAVHPRMRGERLAALHLRGDIAGSSPHARGTLLGGFGLRLEPRFIPACAGNARTPGGAAGTGAVHPRMRGERGRRAAQVGCLPRFIPACAGNAPASSYRWRQPAVHPRMRGERVPATPSCLSAVGSSPHARGTRLLAHQRRKVGRFIPACAGNARQWACPSPPPPVHPRMRGERISRLTIASASAGSSPHARGTQLLPLLIDPQHRFIPACAGNANARRITDNCVYGSSPHARGTLPVNTTHET